MKDFAIRGKAVNSDRTKENVLFTQRIASLRCAVAHIANAKKMHDEY